jgi:AmiR/NasT family two-component response regulator
MHSRPRLLVADDHAGCFAYLVKGVPAERLQSVLRDAVACRRASR